MKQPLRRFSDEKRKTSGFIKEVLHPDWLADPVLVAKKKSDDPFAPKVWRMCVDHTALKKK